MPSDLQIRPATIADLSAIVALLADDAIGATREGDVGDAAYRAAFAAIDADANQLLLVGDRHGRVVACLQLSFIPGLSRRGMWRGQIEGVRVASSERAGGVGRSMIEHAIGLCRGRGCGLVQLTSDKRRPDAIRFYESLGFCSTHEGLKLSLEDSAVGR